MGVRSAGVKRALRAILLVGLAIAIYFAWKSKQVAEPAARQTVEAVGEISTEPARAKSAKKPQPGSTQAVTGSQQDNFSPVDWSQLTDRYAMPATTDPDEDRAGQAKRLRAVFERIKAPLERTRYWQTKLVLPAQGKAIPVTLVLNLYDGSDRDSPFPLRTLREPKFLSWALVGFFDTGDDLVKWSMSSSLENTATRNDKTFLFLHCGGSESLSPWLEFFSVPAPGESAGGEVLLPGEKNWRPLPQPKWEPLTESDYRKVMETLQHDSRY
jgi:hypothetical protein